MERFALCSRILYDNDILDKHNEIIKLKHLLDIPKVLFLNNTEWENAKSKLYTDIKNVINHCVLAEHHYMLEFGLTHSQYTNIARVIEDGLIILTHNDKWSEKIAYEIIYGIDGFFNGLINSNNWENIYNVLSAQDLANIIYKNIEWQFDSGEHYPCILEDIPIFKCINCEKIYNYINDSGLCFTCEYETFIHI